MVEYDSYYVSGERNRSRPHRGRAPIYYCTIYGYLISDVIRWKATSVSSTLQLGVSALLTLIGLRQ